MELLIGKTGNGTATIGCLRPGCGNKVVIKSDVQEALTCNDLKCKTYMGCISSEFMDVKRIAHDYFREIGKYEILGGRKNKDAKDELLSKRDELKMQIWHSYKRTVVNNEVQRKKRAREIREEVDLMELQFKKRCIDAEDGEAAQNTEKKEEVEAEKSDEEEELIEFSGDEEYGQHPETWNADERYEDGLEGMETDNA